MGGAWKNKPLNYWKQWYWDKGGRDKVQQSRKVTQPKRYNNEKD